MIGPFFVAMPLDGALTQRLIGRARPHLPLIGLSCAGFGLLVAIVLALYSALGVIADKANEIDGRRSLTTVSSAIDSAVSDLAARVEDNGVWDDAVEETHKAALDRNWLYNTWGLPAEDGAEFDGAFVFDGNHRLLWGYYDGQPVKRPDAAFLGTGFTALFKGYEDGLAVADAPVAGLSKTAMGPAMVGVGIVRPSTDLEEGVEGAEVPHSGATRYIVLTRHLSARVIQGLAETYTISGLKLAGPNDPARPRLALKGSDGSVVGELVWMLNAPGLEAAHAAWPQIRTTLLLVAGLVVLFITAVGLMVRRLSLSEQRQRQIALTDGLTGLPNRRAAIAMLDTHFDTKRTDAGKMALVYLNLDGFKDVNDTYGHGTGDQLLRLIAQDLGELMGQGSKLARVGGDEFAILSFGPASEDDAHAFAARFLDYLSDPVMIGERTIKLGASMGTVCAYSWECSGLEMFHRAVVAMYDAKANGRGRVSIYNLQMDIERQQKLAIEEGIRAGLERDEFDVVYQPIVNANSGQMVTVEALVRWPRRPEGPLGPDYFIDVAESSGLIHPLGQFVLRKACEDLLASADISLCVNVSPAQFRDPAFEARVAAVLKETGFPPQRLELEITEGYLIGHPERAIEAITRLKGLGLSVALDDFGTGYSSIGYLRRYGFDRVKIDKSLAGQVGLDPQAGALVAATVALANALEMRVTAEGVETEDQARLLRMVGCEKLQGYYYSKPKPFDQLSDLRAPISPPRPAQVPAAARSVGP
jgi:diguanylate cyclase (GGDEF)-like protein